MITKYSFSKVILTFLIITSAVFSAQPHHDVIFLSRFCESNNFGYFMEQWKYSSKDDTANASVSLNDESFEIVNTGLNENNLPKSGWNGKGWFRYKAEIDSSMLNKPMALFIRHGGSIEIYLNGRKIYKSSADSSGSNFTTFTFLKSGMNIFAVRYSNYDSQIYFTAGFDAGFYLVFGPADKRIEYNMNYILSNEIQKNFFTALTMAFGILHLILFLYSRELKSNLYFAVFLVLYALNIYFDYQNFLSTNLKEHLFNIRLHRLVLPFCQIMLLRFVYSLFLSKVPKRFALLVFVGLSTGALAVLKPVEYFSYLQIAMLIFIFENIRVLYIAVKQKVEGVWLVASGFIILFVFSSYDLLVDLNVIEQFGDISNGYVFGLIGLFVFMSTYLARDFAKRNERIIAQDKIVKEQEIQQKILEKDNERKTVELEEARKIQLSMLPACLNDFKGLDICFEMKTATEVGGDYYDYIISRDGTLNIAIGDATGHGAKAGLMVASVKSLFGALGSNLIITDFFSRSTEIIKNMKLGNLFMSMTLLRIKDKNYTLSAAGMPPVLIYRKNINSVEEILIKSMPIGAFNNFPYKTVDGSLDSGDTILLMSDGYPELFNEEKEMLGFERIKEYLKELANFPANRIANELFKRGAEWRGNKAQDDDITFVIIKILEEQG